VGGGAHFGDAFLHGLKGTEVVDLLLVLLDALHVPHHLPLEIVLVSIVLLDGGRIIY
jgi:hypothetical protein